MGFEDLEPIDTLVTIGKKVNNLFTTLDGLIDVDSDDKHPLTNELQRFQLWAVNLGLYHGGHSSLDYRFRDSPPLFEYAYKLLRDLETGLLQCSCPISSEKSHTYWLIELTVREVLSNCTVSSPNDSGLESDSENSEEEEDFSSYQKEPLTKARLDNITTTIDRLYSLSFKLRYPAMRLGLSKAMKYTEVDPETGVNLVEVYSSFDQKHLTEIFRCFGHQNPEDLETHYLVQRLGRANTRRRQQFGYWRKRKFKYKEYSESMERTAGSYSRTVHHSHRGELPVPDGPQSAPSQPSTATWLDQTQIKLEEDLASIVSTKTFLIFADEKCGDIASIPPPPTLYLDTKEFECPYCFMICPRKIANEREWETHVFRDLRPYICTFEDCKDPDQQYDTLSDWIEHEISRHARTAGLRIDNEGYTRDCPFCLCPNASMVHMACHLRRISCFSLPRSAYNREGSKSGSGKSEQAGVVSHGSERSTMDSVSWGDVSEDFRAIRSLGEKMDEVDLYDIHEFEQKTTKEKGKIDILPSDGPYSNSPAVSNLPFSPEDLLGLVLGRLELTGILSVGHYGAIYMAVDMDTNEAYAIKSFMKSGLDPRQLEYQHREIRLHHLASQHPNVVSLLRIVDSAEFMYVVMEFCPEGDLFSSITEKCNFVGNDPSVKNAFLQILESVAHCHSLGIYHRDLRPENILVASSEHGLTLKLTDFGLATTDYSTSDFGCGSLFYMSPGKLTPFTDVGNDYAYYFTFRKENQQEDPRPMSSYISPANDVWSLGVTLINLTCGRNPWKRASTEDPTFRAYLKDPFFLKTILPLSTELLCILNRIFERDPLKRVTIPELRKLILECPRFTITPIAPSRPTSPSLHEEHAPAETTAPTEMSVELQGYNQSRPEESNTTEGRRVLPHRSQMDLDSAITSSRSDEAALGLKLA